MLETDSKQTGGQIISAGKGKLVLEGYLQYNFKYSAQGWPLQGGSIWKEVKSKDKHLIGTRTSQRRGQTQGPKVEKHLAGRKTGKPGLDRSILLGLVGHGNGLGFILITNGSHWRILSRGIQCDLCL